MSFGRRRGCRSLWSGTADKRPPYQTARWNRIRELALGAGTSRSYNPSANQRINPALTVALTAIMKPTHAPVLNREPRRGRRIAYSQAIKAPCANVKATSDTRFTGSAEDCAVQPGLAHIHDEPSYQKSSWPTRSTPSTVIWAFFAGRWEGSEVLLKGIERSRIASLEETPHGCRFLI